MSARVFSSDPSREHAQTEQEEAAILLTSARYFILYLHSTVACRCLLCLLRLFSCLPSASILLPFLRILWISCLALERYEIV